MANTAFYETVLFADSFFPMKMVYTLMPSRYDDHKLLFPPFVHWHEHLEIHWFEKGGARVLTGNEWITAEDGDVTVVNPSELHTVLPGEKDSSYRFFIISPQLLGGNTLGDQGDFWDALDMQRFQFQHLVRDDPRVTKILSKLVKEYAAKASGYELVVRGLLLQLMAQLYRTHRQTLPLSPTKKLQDQRLKDVLLYIASNYDQPLSPQMLADRCQLNLSYFCRLFRQSTGMTATAYITTLRVSKAAELLISTDLSVAEIAAWTGFSDINYFSRCFKQQRGVSPLLFRQEGKSGT